MKLRRHAALAVLLVVGGPMLAPLRAQYGPPTTGGVIRLDELLQRLSEPRRVLMVGAHPDDEDTGLLALFARGFGAEVAYLSLSRGEGGQNLIGSELGVGLGLVRTRELEAARRVDGSKQFFTRAYDFGYSKSLDETSQRWLPDSILKDAVRIVRRFRPHVVVSVWSGTPRDRHGQHQMAGVIAQQVFDAAGDARRFPELGPEEGIDPWTPLKLYRSTRGDAASTTLAFETGVLDPRSGRSFHQIAMASRSQHRSQDMGVLQEIGPRSRGVALWRDRTGGGEGGLFAGVSVAHPWLAALADSLRGELAPRTMSRLVVPIARAVRRARVEGVSPVRAALLQDAVGVAASVVMDAVASRETVVAGGVFHVNVRVHNAGVLQLPISAVRVEGPPGWNISIAEVPGTVAPGQAVDVAVEAVVPPDAHVTQPYFLERPMVGALYDWSAAPPSVRGVPFQPALLRAVVVAELAGTRVTLTKAVTYRFRNQAVGEQRRPIRVVPPVDVRLDPGAVVWSTSSGPDEKNFRVTLRSNLDDPVSGSAQLDVEGWESPEAQPFDLEQPGEEQTLTFAVARPRGVSSARATLRARVSLARGSTVDLGIREVAYPHIDRVAWVLGATADITLAPIALPTIGRIGYVRGASDRVPEALAEVGLAVELLDADSLARGDLSVYDVIVIGSRAYETNDDLARHNDRILKYVRVGGHVVVQYQQYQFVRGGYAPYLLRIGFPHDRVTDETAPVTVLAPSHPIVTRPNPIGVEDWLGWPHERGLYFAAEWDEAFEPILEMADPGESPLRGSLLAAHYGDGTYVYSGISFFRVLPAGTPGAYRLFLNMLQPGW